MPRFLMQNNPRPPGTKNILWIFIFAFSLAGCRTSVRPARIISPEGILPKTAWSREERQKEIAVRTLKTTQEASFHLIRLRTTEKPHTHNNHDLTVVMLSGGARVFIEGRRYEVNPGDIVEIPRGKVHWAENRASEASEVYAVFTPPFDGKDHQIASGWPATADSLQS